MNPLCSPGKQYPLSPKSQPSPKPLISPVVFILIITSTINQMSNDGHSRRAGFDAVLIPG